MEIFIEGNQEARHWLLVKWIVLCLLISFSGVAIGYFFDSNIIAFILVGASSIFGGIFALMAFHNFFFRNPDPEIKYKKAKQPWE